MRKPSSKLAGLNEPGRRQWSKRDTHEKRNYAIVRHSRSVIQLA